MSAALPPSFGGKCGKVLPAANYLGSPVIFSFPPHHTTGFQHEAARQPNLHALPDLLEIWSKMSRLKPRKAAASDHVPNNLLKTLRFDRILQLTGHFMTIANTISEDGGKPASWAQAWLCLSRRFGNPRSPRTTGQFLYSRRFTHFTVNGNGGGMQGRFA